MAAHCACAVRAYLCAYLSLHFMTSCTCFAFWNGGDTRIYGRYAART